MNKENWFTIQLRPMPRTTTKAQWKECDRWRRMTQRVLRKAMPKPPAIDFSGYGYGVDRLTPTSEGGG
jgi:hypothetical protein